MLAVGAIVVSAGFAVGIVAGVAWEEPGLVISWLTGETDSIVEWGVDERGVAGSSGIPDGAQAEVPDVASPPPLGGRKVDASQSGDGDAPPASTAVVRPKTQPALSRVPDRQEASAKIVETGRFSVQVGAFAERTSADELAESLRRAGYLVYLSDSQQGARWRVRIGPHSTRADAEHTAKRLEASQQLPTWVLREDS
jgi:cell division septation protein DedD